ncbi:MAG TPA: fimbrial protein [Rhizobiaceae bacterium]|nr:fimbrial protein [Rhizobiaceae bacterium]
MASINEIEEEKPLDPATEKVRRKMVRLLLVSIGIMMIGLMAVLGAIVYKIGEAPDATIAAVGGMAIEPGTTGTVELPQGAEVISATLDGDNVMLQLRLADGARELVIHSLSRNRIVARLSLE